MEEGCFHQSRLSAGDNKYADKGLGSSDVGKSGCEGCRLQCASCFRPDRLVLGLGCRFWFLHDTSSEDGYRYGEYDFAGFALASAGDTSCLALSAEQRSAG